MTRVSIGVGAIVRTSYNDNMSGIQDQSSIDATAMQSRKGQSDRGQNEATQTDVRKPLLI